MENYKVGLVNLSYLKRVGIGFNLNVTTLNNGLGNDIHNTSSI